MITAELEAPGRFFDVGDRIRITLLPGLEIKTDLLFADIQQRKYVQNSTQPISHTRQTSQKSLDLDVIDYKPKRHGDLVIQGKMQDGYTLELNLSHCADLVVLGASCDYE